MTSLAIIIWASKYTNELKPLPACERDAAAIKTIIEKDSRFEETLTIDNEGSSVVAFEQISNFIKKYANRTIDEIFFYFTGHGEATADDFLFLLPGYKSSGRMSTSLVNSQIDDLVRSLNPKLFVKIVDACESGTAYIKDAANREMLGKGKAGFQSVFFFSSSHSDEKSYLDTHLSYLTECIVKTVYEHPIETIKYVNLLNAAADFFAVIDFQRPYVVQQGSLDSIFCNIDANLRKDLSQYIRVVSPPSATKDAVSTLSLIELVRSDSERYVSKEEADQQLQSIFNEMNNFQLSSEFTGLYNFTVSVVKLGDAPSTRPVAEHISGNKNAEAWFVEISKTMEKFTRRVRKDRFGSSISTMSALARMAMAKDNPEDYTTVEGTRPVITGFRHTSEMTIPAVRIHAAPLYPSLQTIDCFVVPVLSRTTILMAATSRVYVQKSWDSIRFSESNEWFFVEAALKQPTEVVTCSNTIKERFKSLIEEPIRLKYAQSIVTEQTKTTSRRPKQNDREG